MSSAMFDNWDLSGIHAALCLAGVIMSVWCHQLWGRGYFGAENPVQVQGLQRLSFILYALSLCWSLSYGHVRHWQPWPAYVVTLFAVDLYLFSVLLAACMKRKTSRPC